MRKTKIVCTIGPASSSEEVFAEMCKAGLNVARLNFSHGTHEEHQQKFDMIHKVRKALGLPIAIMLDTKGPEYRICTFKNKKILLQDGDAFTFTTRQVEGDETIVGVSYAGLANDLSVGDTVLVNNGLVIFTVERIEGTEIHCRVVVGGELSDRKSMSFPHKVLEQVYLSEQDKDDLLFGIRNGIDFVAASFVSRRQDVLDVRNFLDANGGQDIEIIAKIENQHGHRQCGGDLRGLCRHHDRPRRLGRGGAVCGASGHPEIPHHQVPPARASGSSRPRKCSNP